MDPSRKTPVRDLVDFQWRVHDGGYRWAEAFRMQEGTNVGSAPREFVLTSGNPPGTAVSFRLYRPQDDPSLFRVFADLPEEGREAVAEFASRYGLLEGGWPCVLAQDADNLLTAALEGSGNPYIIGEPYSAWVTHIRALRHAVQLFDIIRVGKAGELKDRLVWLTGQGCWHYHSPFFDSSILSDLPLGPDDMGPAASVVLLRVVNQTLVQHVAPQLRFDPNAAKMVLRIVPTSLLGCLWLQLAQAIDTGSEQRQCKQCGRWFAISNTRDGRTRRRLFCSAACKTTDYHRRQEKAVGLASRGKSIEEIAVELDTEPATIKKWVGPRKRRKNRHRRRK